ncbi:glycosyltransferase [Flavobacteriaceae bacterium AU392]|nr:glycosyltransferase [Flavobacteriaceae bacterium]RKM84173.1 glycosyltransferase [Flavobacteriaceae bacterium AU392]
MLFVFSGVTFFYLFLIISLIVGFNKVTPFTTSSFNSKTYFSIIIPFRNEAAVLQNLLVSLNHLQYPKEDFEILLINDNSTDNSVEIIEHFKKENPKLNITILKNKRLSNAPKKDAITTAVSIAKYSWIITTDADCEFSSQWLKTVDNFIQQQSPKMIIAPVIYNSNNSFLKLFQALDFLSLQSATIGSFGLKRPFLCNGANFIYQKELFTNLNGFEGNTKIASGDDIFLMEKAITKHPNDVLYLKSTDAIVSTIPQPDFKSLLYQRMRWAAKTSAYHNVFGKLVGLLIFLMNGVVIIGLCFSIVGILNWFMLAYMLAIKFIIDYIFIYKSAKLFKQIPYLIAYPISAILYPFFSVLVVILTVFLDYKWKGRFFKK